MSATEVLRRLLDERGVEWMDDSYAQLWCTVWDGQDGKQWRMTENQSGMLTELKAWKVSPAQAIAATLGPTATTVDETETWECVCDQIGRYGKRVTVHVMECSECGHTYEHVNGDYEFCPHCGRRVVEVDE